MTQSNVVEDVTQSFPRWNHESVADLTEAKMVSVDGAVCYTNEVEEYKKGEKTGKMINIYMVNLVIDGQTKPAKFGSESMVACAAKYGKNPQKWHNKVVIAKHASVGTNKYIIWTPKAALDKSK